MQRECIRVYNTKFHKMKSTAVLNGYLLWFRLHEPQPLDERRPRNRVGEHGWQNMRRLSFQMKVDAPALVLGSRAKRFQIDLRGDRSSFQVKAQIKLAKSQSIIAASG
jgi:hypothetical protein